MCQSQETIRGESFLAFDLLARKPPHTMPSRFWDTDDTLCPEGRKARGADRSRARVVRESSRFRMRLSAGSARLIWRDPM